MGGSRKYFCHLGKVYMKVGGKADFCYCTNLYIRFYDSLSGGKRKEGVYQSKIADLTCHIKLKCCKRDLQLNATNEIFPKECNSFNHDIGQLERD